MNAMLVSLFLPLTTSLLVGTLRTPASSSTRAPPPLATSPSVPNWFVQVPRTVSTMADQAAKSVGGAVRAGQRRVIVEAAVPELEPTGAAFRLPQLIAFAQAMALSLLEPQEQIVVASRPTIKLLFASTADAKLSGATAPTASVAVSVLGHPSMVDPSDGAFVVVAPNVAQKSTDAEAALRGLLGAAQGRPVIVLNPRLGGGSAALGSCETVYLLRPLELAYLRDQFADRVERTNACLLRCFPHEWCARLPTRAPPAAF